MIITQKSKHVEDIHLTVYRDGSGGYFSFEDLIPIALIDMGLTDREMRILNQEYDDLLHTVTRKKNE